MRNCAEANVSKIVPLALDRAPEVAVGEVLDTCALSPSPAWERHAIACRSQDAAREGEWQSPSPGWVATTPAGPMLEGSSATDAGRPQRSRRDPAVVEEDSRRTS